MDLAIRSSDRYNCSLFVLYHSIATHCINLQVSAALTDITVEHRDRLCVQPVTASRTLSQGAGQLLSRLSSRSCACAAALLRLRCCMHA
jgi:hypothetical protein